MTRVRTLSRFSTPLLKPPKNSYVSFFCLTATWSPPRPSAISSALRAHCSASCRDSAPRATPIETVALRRSPALISRILSRTSKRFSMACRI